MEIVRGRVNQEVGLLQSCQIYVYSVSIYENYKGNKHKIKGEGRGGEGGGTGWGGVEGWGENADNCN